MKRETGYYWVKYNDKWVIAHFENRPTLFLDILNRPISQWEPLPHVNHEFNHRFVSEHDLQQINETRILNTDGI